MTEDWVAEQFKAIGLQNVRRQELEMKPLWYPDAWKAEVSLGGAATALKTTFPINGTVGTAGGLKGKVGTRRRFPQASGDLRVRWCSAVLKIDTFALAVNNEPAFKHGCKLLVDGVGGQMPRFQMHSVSDHHSLAERSRGSEQYHSTNSSIA